MATIVNARDVLLQAASPRVVPMSLPPNVTVPNGQVLGLGELALLDAISTSKVSGLGALATQNVIDLATQVTGQLASGKVSGLGALALLNQINLATQATGSLPYSNVSGLGALATQNSVNGSTQVTNLGSLAYANSIAADQIGAGSLAAGVIYAGSVSASQITTGTMTSGSINTSGYIRAYGNYATGVSYGGETYYPTVFAKSSGSVGPSIYAESEGRAIHAKSTGVRSAVWVDAYSDGIYSISQLNGNAVTGSGTASAATGVLAQNGFGGYALRVNGNMSINNTSLVANLNAQYLQGKTPSDFAEASSLSNYATNAYVNENFLKAGGTFTGRTNSGAFLKVTAGAATIYLPIYL